VAAAVDALIAANRANDLHELLGILEPDSGKLIYSGDPVADSSGRARFLAAYDDAHRLDSDGADKATLVVGKEGWPLPIPLVREHGAWRFDTTAGAAEILDRQIGRDELTVIQVCRAYVVAQREYAALRFRSGGAAEYAQHFMSAAGQRNGLYWPVGPGEEESPLGPLIARARRLHARRTTPGTPALLWLLFPDTDPAGDACAGRRPQLCHRRSDDRRVCPVGLPGDLRRLGYHDIRRQPGRHRLPEELRPCDLAGRTADHPIRSGSELAAQPAMTVCSRV
jgi:Protein of unknown function (DUF2950)